MIKNLESNTSLALDSLDRQAKKKKSSPCSDWIIREENDESFHEETNEEKRLESMIGDLLELLKKAQQRAKETAA